MSFADDVRRTIQAVQAAGGAIVSVAQATDTLRPLAEAAIRGDARAEAELRSLTTDSTVPATVNAAARILVEYVQARKTVGRGVTRVGVGVYPGQLSPFVAIVLGFMLLSRVRS